MFFGGFALVFVFAKKIFRKKFRTPNFERQDAIQEEQADRQATRCTTGKNDDDDETNVLPGSKLSLDVSAKDLEELQARLAEFMKSHHQNDTDVASSETAAAAAAAATTGGDDPLAQIKAQIEALLQSEQPNAHAQLCREEASALSLLKELREADRQALRRIEVIIEAFFEATVARGDTPEEPWIMTQLVRRLRTFAPGSRSPPCNEVLEGILMPDAANFWTSLTAAEYKKWLFEVLPKAADRRVFEQDPALTVRAMLEFPRSNAYRRKFVGWPRPVESRSYFTNVALIIAAAMLAEGALDGVKKSSSSSSNNNNELSNNDNNRKPSVSWTQSWNPFTSLLFAASATGTVEWTMNMVSSPFSLGERLVRIFNFVVGELEPRAHVTSPQASALFRALRPVASNSEAFVDLLHAIGRFIGWTSPSVSSVATAEAAAAAAALTPPRPLLGANGGVEPIPPALAAALQNLLVIPADPVAAQQFCECHYTVRNWLLLKVIAHLAQQPLVMHAFCRPAADPLPLQHQHFIGLLAHLIPKLLSGLDRVEASSAFCGKWKVSYALLIFALLEGIVRMESLRGAPNPYAEMANDFATLFMAAAQYAGRIAAASLFSAMIEMHGKNAKLPLWFAKKLPRVLRNAELSPLFDGGENTTK